MSETLIYVDEDKQIAAQRLWRAVIASTVQEWISGPLRRQREAEQFDEKARILRQHVVAMSTKSTSIDAERQKTAAEDARQIRERAVVDATPWLRPMLAVLDEYHRACVVVVDRESARFWELYLNELRELDRLRDEVLRKPDYAGWGGFAEHGVHHEAEELEKRHYRRVVGVLDRLFRTERPELLVIGGRLGSSFSAAFRRSAARVRNSTASRDFNSARPE